LDADARLRGRAARIHAQTLRAQIYLNKEDYTAALTDVEELLSIRVGNSDSSAKSTASITPEESSRLHRLAAEAHEGLANYDAAARCWQLAARDDPQFATKSKKEVARLFLLQQQQKQQ
jgi:tetratricopeptide (TPR) repeat protein